jgi:hypothetical protein
MNPLAGRSSRRSGRDLFELIPDPWRGRIGLRRSRRWVRAVRFARRHNQSLAKDAPAVSFYPMRLEPTAALAHVFKRLGVRIVDFGRPADVTVAWETGTWLSDRDARKLPLRALNRACVDISKSTVDRVWAEVSGYSISVDPLTWSGRMVAKPIRNATRGGQLVQGPMQRRGRDLVYQRLIDSRVGDRIHSTRAVIIDQRVVHAYEKWRPYPQWFRGHEKTLPGSVDDLYSAAEQVLLVRFAEAIGMDYGELDVLRDNSSRLIYVVDANRTPVRPKGLPREYDDAWFGPMADAFRALLERQRAELFGG